LQASRGEQVLLSRIVQHFPGHSDFLDGDITFRKLHWIFDFFVDELRDLSPLVPGTGASKVMNLQKFSTKNGRRQRRQLRESFKITTPKVLKGKMQYPWEAEGKRVIPEPYDFRSANRSAVVSVGYTAYTRDSSTYFTGNRIGGAFIDRSIFFRYWRAVKDRIDLPFIAVCTLNENWGMLSTMLPNRTAGWGRCCDRPQDRIVYEYLNHPKTLMLVTNQHVNVSHPKLMIMPRGIPLTWGFTRMILWDTMRKTLHQTRKKKLLFAASSSWGPRPQILKCISKNVPASQFDGHVKTPKGGRLSRNQFYEKLGTSMFGLGLPGLGYDTFRAWELMTMGTIVVLEKGVGFDRTMYRLPALLVEDFAEITPELLRQAYVEALYRADDFEYDRLKQSWWYGFIANVSATMSVQTILDAFPMSAEEPNFARPRVPYECGKTNTCGPGTKRTPKRSC